MRGWKKLVADALNSRKDVGCGHENGPCRSRNFALDFGTNPKSQTLEQERDVAAYSSSVLIKQKC